MAALERKQIHRSGTTSEAPPRLDNSAELKKIRREVLTISDLAKKLADRIDVLIAQQGQDLA